MSIGHSHMWICCKLSLQYAHISLRVKGTDLVMEVRYSSQGISQMNMKSDKKPIINPTMSIKVHFLLSITPLCNKVPGTHN